MLLFGKTVQGGIQKIQFVSILSIQFSNIGCCNLKVQTLNYATLKLAWQTVSVSCVMFSCISRHTGGPAEMGYSLVNERQFAR